MARPILPSAGCLMPRCHISPATHFLHQYQRTVTTLSARSSSRACSNTLRPILPFLLSPRYAQAARLSPLPPSYAAHLHASAQPQPEQTAQPPKAAETTTRVLLNPREDEEEGGIMMIKISPRAAKRLKEITSPSASKTSLSKQGPYDHLRVTVTSGGCHGFQYGMSLDPASNIDQEEDTVFEAVVEDSGSEVPADQGTAKVAMDSSSLEILKGSTIDYTVELIGSQFKVVDNPRATSNCGCGTSFDVK